MPTVNFRCSFCGNEVDVADEQLGQPIHCPHCQRVLTPLLPTVAAASLPTESLLAGSATLHAAVPAQDMPLTEIPGALPQVLIVASQSAAALRTQEVSPGGGETHAFLPSPVAQPAVESLAPSSEQVPTYSPVAQPADGAEAVESRFLTGSTSPDSAGSLSLTAEAEMTAFPGAPHRPMIQHGRGSSWFLALVVIPLISYSILATILIVILYTRLQAAQRSPLEELPDLEGELRGAARQKQSSLSYERIAPETALPARLCVRLGETIRVGDLEATPRRVELRRLLFETPGARPETSAHESLVLHLHLKNVSHDVVFAPTDPFLERRWKPKTDPRGTRPYTFVELGTQKLYGGPIAWRPGKADPPQRVDGQKYGRLWPGQELDTIVCTDPDDQAAGRLRTHQGPVRWRVQLRRGLVRVQDRDVSATAVIGVEFTDSDVQRAPNAL